MTDIDEQTEKEIAKGLRGKDNSAMHSFYTIYARMLTAVCARYIQDDDDVKDVLQEALIKVFTRADSFTYKGRGSLSAWAVRIVVNQSLMFLRGKRFEEPMPEYELPDIADNEELDINDISPGIIQEMIRQLPDGYRTVFNLYVFEDNTHKDIAKKLGIKESSSASQLLRAKKILKRKIKDYRKKGGVGL